MSALEILGLSLLALFVLAGALGTVLSKNLVHSVLWLALALVATAGIYVRLTAGFLAGAQVLLYAGGVITLAIFAVMLSARIEGGPIPNESAKRGRGALVALAVAGLFGGVLLQADVLAPRDLPVVDAADIGRSFLGEYVLPFEVLSVLLVAAMIGAIVIARREDP
ncbi:MAG: NADH-quinone oxidoreductase subunit J [Planctomycetes bacterium]|nr:NADH-quinone oxidoreductase subunit J [Planctomycetota bacterium]